MCLVLIGAVLTAHSSWKTHQPLTTRGTAHRDTCICHSHLCRLRNHNGHFSEEPTSSQKPTQHFDSIPRQSTTVSAPPSPSPKVFRCVARLSRTCPCLHLHHFLPRCATLRALFEGLQAKSAAAQHLTNPRPWYSPPELSPG